MSFRHSLGKVIGPISHLPTWFFILGYPLFWLELYFFKHFQGQSSWLAWGLFVLVGLFGIWSNLSKPHTFGFKQWWGQLKLQERVLWLSGFLLISGILIIVTLAGLKPIHLLQEFDCLEYHYALPRQHLILGSFAHIPWAADDLFLLPLDFALSPFWFATNLPNKLPQLIILLGLLAVLFRLVLDWAGSHRPWMPYLAVFAFLASHGFGIQMGTGMLDLAVIYLFLASLDSLHRGRWAFAAVEFCFFMWSKPLMPLQVLAVASLVILAYWIARYFKWQIVFEVSLEHWKKAAGLLILLSVVVAGPFIYKSIIYAATPSFPWAPGVLGAFGKLETNPLAWESLQKASYHWMVLVKDGYGHGRDGLAFLKHFWLLAVPEKGVNNSFDYPLGLPYLLFLGPFLFYWVKDILARRCSILPLMIVIMWGLWWFGSQQSRFLFIPLLLMFIWTLLRFSKMSRWLLGCVVLALALNVISLWGAHKRDLLQAPITVVRSQDIQLMGQGSSKNPTEEYVEWPTHDVAYAQYPVMVRKENLPHTIVF